MWTLIALACSTWADVTKSLVFKMAGGSSRHASEPKERLSADNSSDKYHDRHSGSSSHRGDHRDDASVDYVERVSSNQTKSKSKVTAVDVANAKVKEASVEVLDPREHIMNAPGPSANNVQFDNLMKMMGTFVSAMGQKKAKKRAHEISDSESDFDSDGSDDSGSSEDPTENGMFPGASGIADPLNDLASMLGRVGPPSAAVSGASAFDSVMSSLERCFLMEEEKGPAVTPGLAGIVNRSLRLQPNENKIKDAGLTYKSPENIANLAVPKTNGDVWEKLHKGSKFMDLMAQKAQFALSKGLVPLIHFLHDVGTKATKSTEEYLLPINDSLRMIVAAFNYLSQLRKDIIRNDYKDNCVTKLCTWDTAVGDVELFPFDFLKRVGEIKKAKRLGAAYKSKTGTYKRYYKSHKNKQGNKKFKRPFLGHKKKGQKEKD